MGHREASSQPPRSPDRRSAPPSPPGDLADAGRGFPTAEDPVRLLQRLPLRQLAVLASIREATVHHGWTTTHEIGRLMVVASVTDSLQLVQDLNDLHEHGLIQKEIPPGTGPTLYALTLAGRKAASA